MPSEKRSRSIYFIVPAPMGVSPGQRFRFEHYLGALKNERLPYHISSFYTLQGWNALYAQGGALRKAFSVVRGFLKRIKDLFLVAGYSHVYIYREAAPLGPPFFEWVIAKVLRKKVVYDFDDAIWIPVVSENNKIVKNLKCFFKVKKICKWATIVTVGNTFLAEYARKQNQQVVIVPTVVDTQKVHNKKKQHTNDVPVIGWTGTHTTLKFLDIILPVLQALQKDIKFTFLVIADTDPNLPLINYSFVKWNKDTEIEDLLKMDIGIMPLTDDDLSKGKCGFKAIQYMALGIPAVVSPVGVNSDIVQDGSNGFICSTNNEWEKKLQILLLDVNERIRVGENGKKTIEEKFSVATTQNLFLGLFQTNT
ncbi:MAG: glycosyltransferase [Cytophagia bacterium]|nr:MAG: glycosyltransferase [Cytophagia bacterium]